jgi:hypothetical protein
MKNAFVIFLVLIFSGLNLFSQSFKQNIDVLISAENQYTAVFFIADIKDSISIDKLESESEIVNEETIYPLKKENLEDKLSWNFSWGISSNKTVIYIHFNPFYVNALGEIHKIKSISIDVNSTKPKKQLVGNYKTANQSVLAQGKWHKYAIISEGIYKIDYASMLSNGIAVNEISSLNDIKLHSFGGEMLPYGNTAKQKDDLPEIAIKRVDNGNGIFDEGDYIIFYAKAGVQWSYDEVDEIFKHKINIYSDTTFYYLNYNSNGSKEIGQQISSNTKTIDEYSFLDRQFHESEERNLLRSGNLWLGDHFGETQTKQFKLNFPNVDKSENVKLYSRLYAKNQASGGSTFDIEMNNGGKQTISIASISGNSTDDIAKNAINKYNILPTSDTIEVQYTYNAPYSFSEGWIDFFDINAYRKLIYTNSPLIFSNPKHTGTGKVINYHISQCNNNLMLWEIGDFENVKNISYTLSNDSIHFNVNADSLREFILFNPAQALSPLYYEQVKNQNLHALNSSKLLIITHPSLLGEALRLANFHEQQDSLSTNVVLINEIYNEFSGGVKDVCGIRNFIRMLYQKTYPGSDTLQYVLLFGDGTFDYKNIMPGNKNLIPTFQSVNSTKETASYTSDDFFALLDDNEGAWTISGSELPDVAIGRIPVSAISDAKIVVDKIFSYSNYFDGQNSKMTDDKQNLFSNWKNEIMFIADDEDFNIHMKQADQLAVKIDNNYPEFNIDKVFLDSYKQEGNSSQPLYPEAKRTIVDKINKGVFLVNYTGHGGEDGLSAERVIETQDLRALKNGIKMPLFFTATCDFSRFDLVDATSAGEALLLNENGGAIALFTTTRIVYSSPNFNLNNNFYNIVFAKKEGENTHIGDVFKDTKVLNNGGLNDRNFTLLGDPALRLTLPSKAITTKLNSVFNLSQNISTDTLKALMKVRITGEITDTSGVKRSDFNGYISTKLFDKKIPYTTLLNDGGITNFTYNHQHNMLTEVKNTVKNGEFTAEFIVPKDIAYQIDYGKMSFYAASDKQLECNGYHKTLLGGTETNAYNDNVGPELKLYMNDSSFIFGNATDNSPLILVILNDSSGINITSENIAHSMTAIIDEKSTQSIALNSYFEPKVNSYQEGKIQYRLADLAPGRHSVEVKAFDNYNNSSRAYTEFFVAADARIALAHLLNYPNPFTTNTSFYFEHNQPGKNLEITLQIFTISGKVIKTFRENLYSENIRVGPISWDGLDDYGDAIGKGVYIYQLQVKGEDGSSAQHFEKLVILK